ncbi:MAG: EVE domain-containing protein [Raineya sp.]|jgi:predicted RNA-binding protein with PUA-like domain|nr:EVE domain-containing protein [Raineya sp.]
MNYWLIKSEPFKYSWDNLEKDQTTFWDGVRNYQARNNLKAMKKGDYALFYHSNDGKEIVGVAQISKEAYPDPTDKDWVLVDVVPYLKFEKKISLEMLKQHAILKNMALVKQSRLSVCPVTQEEFEIICTLANAKIE